MVSFLSSLPSLQNVVVPGRETVVGAPVVDIDAEGLIFVAVVIGTGVVISTVLPLGLTLGNVELSFVVVGTDVGVDISTVLPCGVVLLTLIVVL